MYLLFPFLLCLFPIHTIYAENYVEIDKKDMDLYQSRTDIVVKLKNFKRNIPLPNILRDYLITSAKLEEGVLHIQFEKGEETHE